MPSIKYDQYINDVQKLYLDGYNCNKIADILNIPLYMVYICCKKLNIKLQTNKEILSLRRGSKSPLWAGFEDIPMSYFGPLKACAKARNIEFNISIEDIWNLYISQNKVCKLSGANIYFGSKKIKGIIRNASVDRIDSNIGYQLDNIQLVDKKINSMKKDFSLSHFLYLCESVVNPVKDYDYIYNKNINVNLTYRVCERRAKCKKFKFDLKRENIIDLYHSQGKRCAVTNIPIEFKAEYRKPFFNQCSIDRINSDEGYILSNIRLVLKDINFLKNKYDNILFINTCKSIVEYTRGTYAKS